MEFLLNWILNVPGFAVPFALAALGLIVCERAGVLNLGAEGFMVGGALAGVGLVLNGAAPAIALGGSVLTAMALGLLFSALAVSLRVNHVIAGLALVFFAQALASYLANANDWANLSFAGLGDIALGQDALVFATPVLCAGVLWMLNRTRFGLMVRAVGENPAAADAAGIDVTLVRIAAVLIGAALLGLAGGYLTVAVSKIWVDTVVGGRGWIAIALVIFARWHPWRALAGAVLFGAIEALIPRVNAAGWSVSQYFLQMTPYLATLAVMVWTASRAGERWMQPAALGRHHIREDRD
jgi:simple sugar transport system permease protein